MTGGAAAEPTAPRVRIELCGTLRVVHDGTLVDPELFGGRRARQAFAYLVLERHRAVTRDELAEAIWPGEVPPTWPSAVRSALSRIRDVGRAVGWDGDVVRVALINRHPERALPLVVRLPGVGAGKATVRQLTARHYFAEPVAWQEQALQFANGQVALTLPRHSFAVLRVGPG